MEHKIILKCRVCLDEFDEEQMYELFKKEANDSGLLSEKIEICCGVRIRNSAEMPTKICNNCLEMTCMWFNFRAMCVNSQVYLESLCKDRNKPPELQNGDVSDYLEYLQKELQIDCAERYSSNTLNTSIDASSSINDSNNADNEDEYGDEFLEAVPLDAADSDPDFDNIIQNIKKEQDELHNEKHEKKTAKTKASQKLKKRDQFDTPLARLQKKYPGYIPKKCLRPPSPTSYMCSICGNVYTKKAAFQYHMNLHSEVKPHSCELCDKKFRQVSELRNHMRRHTGEKPYKCAYCERHFIDRSEKHRHERVHTNSRPYVCSLCGKSFMYSAILKNHQKLHSGEKDFNCLVCHKAFTLHHQLKAHLTTITHKQKEAQFLTAGYTVVYE